MTLAVVDTLRQWARALKRDAVALWFACRDPRTPLLAKGLALFTVGYALSPIDLIPDFIPVLGFVDDAIVLPALIWLALRLVPAEVMADCRRRADERLAAGEGKPVSRLGAAVIVLLWIAALAWAWVAFVQPRL